MGERYFLDRDGDGHWYIIPEAKRAEWDAWCNTADEDAPDWADEVGGNPSLVTFERPENP